MNKKEGFGGFCVWEEVVGVGLKELREWGKARSAANK